MTNEWREKQVSDYCEIRRKLGTEGIKSPECEQLALQLWLAFQERYGGKKGVVGPGGSEAPL